MLPTLPQTPVPQQPRSIAAVYARVSTTEQADKGYSLPTQIASCQALARREGYAIPGDHVFVDDYTGTALRRPALTALRELIRRRQIQALLIYDIDRLSRRLAHQLLLNEELERHGVTLLVATM